MKRLMISSVLGLMGSCCLFGVCFNLEFTPCATISNCDSYPDGGMPWLGSGTPGSVGYSGLYIVEYPSSVTDGHRSGWNSADSFTQEPDFTLQVCWSADTVTWYTGPCCTGMAMGTARGVQMSAVVTFIWPPSYPANCNLGS